MGTQKLMPPAFESTLAFRAGHPEEQPAGETEERFSVVVIYTSAGPTAAALKEAGAVASTADATVTLLVPQIVPFPLPLTTPPVLLEFNARRFRAIAEQCPVETRVNIYLCRDRLELLRTVLRPRSVVFVGGKKSRWWPTHEQRLAGRLRRAGHEVILSEVD